MRWKMVAGAFAFVIFAATGAIAQDQTPSEQKSPTQQSSAQEPSAQNSADSETPRTIRVGGNVAQANLVSQVTPVYPLLAKTAHISGTVVLHCIIGKDGAVEEVRFVSGPPLLMQSAMDAVRQWKYKPVLLDGKPVLVATTISVVFTLGGPDNAPAAIKPDPIPQYKPRGYVSDFAGIIDSQVQAQLEMICKDLDQKTETEMLFVTVASLGGLPIKEFATRLANAWGVEHKDTNRGVLVLLSPNDRQYRIAVSRGLESTLSDDDADRLGREMLPMLRKGDFGEALLHLAQRMQAELQEKLK